MAEAVEAHYGACEGLVITRYGYARPCKGIEIVEAAHPVPDARGEAATRRLLDLVSGLSPDDLVLALISGGGSALLCAPSKGVSLIEKMAVNQALLTSGAPIGDMNIVRKHLSRIKGGQLAVACHPARVLTLLISDVPGDDPGQIASGPTVGEMSTLAAALVLDGQSGIHVLACDTDGVDGAADVAGAYAGPATLEMARQRGADPELALAENDAHSFFGAIDGQAITGPTLTNVNDFRAVLVLP